MARERICWAQTFCVLALANLMVIVHSLRSAPHREIAVSEELEIGPEGSADKEHVVDHDRIILKNVNIRSGSYLAGLFDGAINIAAVEFVISRNVQDRLVGHAFKQQGYAAL